MCVVKRWFALQSSFQWQDTWKVKILLIVTQPHATRYVLAHERGRYTTAPQLSFSIDLVRVILRTTNCNAARLSEALHSPLILLTHHLIGMKDDISGTPFRILEP